MARHVITTAERKVFEAYCHLKEAAVNSHDCWESGERQLLGSTYWRKCSTSLKPFFLVRSWNPLRAAQENARLYQDSKLQASSRWFVASVIFFLHTVPAGVPSDFDSKLEEDNL